MATVTTIDINNFKFEKYWTVFESTIEITGYAKVEHSSTWTEDNLKPLTKRSQGRDIVFFSKKLKTDPHFHTGHEHRLFLSGSGTFFIPTDEFLHIVECGPGDLITLNPKVVHWFKSEKNLQAIRFFEDDLVHTEQTDVPDSIRLLKKNFKKRKINV
jgi:mannose-6-phosphate isomerase-like protein (cupin superfamily)